MSIAQPKSAAPSDSKLSTLELRAATLLAGIYACRMLGLFLLFPSFSLLARDLPGATPTRIGLALGAYSLMQALLQIPAGVLSDRFGRKRMLLLGLSLFITGSVLGVFANDIYSLIGARLLQGAGAVSAICLAYVADVTRGSQHGKVMAIIGISIALSFILAFLLGSVIAVAWGLQGLYISLLGLSILAFLLAGLLPQVTENKRVFHRSDLVKAFSQRALLSVNIQIAGLHCLLSASFFFLPLLFSRVFAQNGQPFNTVWLYLPAILLAFILVMPWLRKKDQLARRLPWFWSGFALILAVFAVTPLTQHYVSVVILLCGFFFTFTFIEASLPARLFQVSGDLPKGAVSGVFSLYQFLGSFLGGLLSGKLFAWLSENPSVSFGSPDIAVFSWAFLALASLAGLISLTLHCQKHRMS